MINDIKKFEKKIKDYIKGLQSQAETFEAIINNPTFSFTKEDIGIFKGKIYQIKYTIEFLKDLIGE